jgi:pimeloyl-ACP methyl ester carboxylesterase
MPTHPPAVARDKSTNGRSLPLVLRLVRLWFRLLCGVAPGLADRHAARLFFSPRRQPRRGALRIGGAEGTPFTVRAGADEVACWSHGSGLTVLLVHGWEGTSHDWEQIATAVVAAGYRAVLLDLPAHGLSAGRRTTLPAIVRVLRAVEERVTVSPTGAREPLAAIIGHSFGGAAAALALRDGLAARRAVLIAPVADPPAYISQVAAMLGLSPARKAGMAERIRMVAGVEFPELDAARAARELKIPGLVARTGSFPGSTAAPSPTPGRAPSSSAPAAWATAECCAPEIVARSIDFLGQKAAAGADQHPRIAARQHRGADQALHP